jgi:PGF-pre-PGF domain-containing protein
MKADRKFYSTRLALIGLTLFIILISSIASAVPYAYIPNSDNNTVSVIDTATNKVTTVTVGNDPFGVAVTPDGSKAYVTISPDYNGNTVSVIDTATNMVSTVTVGYSPVQVAVNPDGSKAYVTNWKDNTLSVIDTATNVVVSTVPVDNDPEGIAVSPDGTKLYVASVTGNIVDVLDTSSNSVIANVPVGIAPMSIAVTSNGTRAYVANRDSNNVSVIDTVTNTVAATIDTGQAPRGVAVTPDEKKVYVTCSGSNIVYVFNTTTNTVNTVTVGKAPFGVAVTPNGKEVYIANKDSNTVSIIDTATDKVKTTVKVGKSPIAYGKFMGPLPVLPLADFSANPTSGDAPLSVQFTDLSKNETLRIWSFGDKNISTELNPTHTYLAKGNYNVILLASNINGINSKSTMINVSERSLIPIADFSANPTSGTSPLAVQFIDLSQNVESRIWNFGDGTTSTEQNPLHTYSSGDYIVNLTISNAKGTNSKTATINVQNGGGDGDNSESSNNDGSSSSSSSSGGGGGSPEPQSNVEVKELSQTFVTGGKEAKFEFKRNVTCVEYVSFNAKKTLGKTTTISEMLKEKSALVPDLPAGEVYKSFNVWVGNGGVATSKNIENAVICFKVDYSWLHNKSGDQSSVTLNRYSDKKWNRLPTHLLGVDAKYMYFTAETPEFSSFAIMVNTTEKSISPNVDPVTTPKIEENFEKKSAVGTINSSEKKSIKTPGFEIVYGMIGLFTVFMRKRKQNQ